MGFERMNKLSEWGAKPVPLPRSLVLTVLLFVVVLTIEAFARLKADRNTPIRYTPVPCVCDGKNPTYL